MGYESMKTMPLSIQKQFLYAAESGRFNKLREVLEQYNETDVRDYYGNTPLILAARNGNTRTLAALFAAGANIHAYNEAGENALLMAAREAHPRVVRLLLEQCAKFEKRHGNSRALALLKPDENSALRARHLNSTSDPTWEPWSSIKEPSELRIQRVGLLLCKVVTLLIDFGADINVLDDEDNTPLHNFIESGLDGCARLLLEHAPDLNAVDGSGCTPLITALMWDKEELAMLFLEAGADPNAGSSRLKPILVAVATDISSEIIKKLIEAGADVAVSDKYGETALHMAVGRRKESRAVTQILLDAGADINAQDSRGFFVSDYALMAAVNWHAIALPLRWKYSAIPQEYPLISFDEGHAKLVCAARDGDITVMASFNLPEVPERIKVLALHAAVHSGQIECCRLLLDKGVDPDTPVRYSGTPLTITAQNLEVEIAGLLLSYGADVDKAGLGYYPLCMACQSWTGEHPDASAEQRQKMAKLLLEHGADVNNKDCCGQTPLRQAVLAVFDIELVRLLLEHGARMDIKDDDGRTPLQLAEEHCSKEMVSLLKEYKKN